MKNAVLEKLEKEALAFPEKARTFIIKDSKTFDRANEFYQTNKAMMKQIRNCFEKLKAKAREAHQAVVDEEKKQLKPCMEAEEIISPKIGAYLKEQKRIREEAMEKARIEKEKEEARLEKIRIDRERKAHEAAEQGNLKAVAEIMSKPEPEPKPTIEIPKPPEAKGTFVRKTLKWRCTNLEDVPRDMLMLDSAKIYRLGQETKGKAVIPGIEFYYEETPGWRQG